MASEPWLSIKVELLSGRGLVLDHGPGRTMIASRRHSLAELAEAIDLAFTRWDHSHLHAFEFGDGRRYMLGGSDFEPEVVDSAAATLGALDLRPGSGFEYVFDLGDDWRHTCEVQATDVDPEEEYGAPPDQPVPIWGWGGSPTSTAASRRTSRPAVLASRAGNSDLSRGALLRERASGETAHRSLEPESADGRSDPFAFSGRLRG